MDHLYETLATEIAARIEQGFFRSGERLPGVRAFSGQRGVSVATAVAAYRKLEDNGYIDARPRSGFYRISLQQPYLNSPWLGCWRAEPTNVTCAGYAANMPVRYNA